HATMQTVGPQTITATDTVNSTLTGTANITVNAVPVATHFAVSARTHVLVGAASPMTVVALDASNHPVFNYTGTVHFSSTDGAAVLPTDYTFVASDHGYHAFTVTMTTTGPQTISVLDSVAMLNGSVNLFVYHA